MAETLFTDIIENLGKTKVKVIGSGSKTGKQQIVGAPSGITSDKETINLQGSAEIPITNNVDFLLDGQYNKFRDNIEYKDNQIFLEDAPSNIDRKVGIGFNKGGEGFSGYGKYGIDSGEPELFVKYKKSFADGGSTNGSGDAALNAKVKELMDDGYEFGEAVKEAMRQGYKKGGRIGYAQAGLVDPANGVIKGQDLGRGIQQRLKGKKIVYITSGLGNTPLTEHNTYRDAQNFRQDLIANQGDPKTRVKEYKGKYKYKELIKDKDFKNFWESKVDNVSLDASVQGQGTNQEIEKVRKKYKLKKTDYENIFNKLVEETRITESVRKGVIKPGQEKLVSNKIVENLIDTFNKSYKPNLGTIDTRTMSKLLKLPEGELEKVMSFIDKDLPEEKFRIAESSNVSRTGKAAAVKSKLAEAGITYERQIKDGKKGTRYRFKADSDIKKSNEKFKQLEKSKTFGFMDKPNRKYPRNYKEDLTVISRSSPEYKKQGYSKDSGAMKRLTNALNNAVRGMTDAQLKTFINENPKIKNLVTSYFNSRTGTIENFKLNEMTMSQIRQNLQFERDHIRGKSTIKYDAGTKKILNGIGLEYPENLYIINKALNMSTKQAVENFVAERPNETKKIKKIDKYFKDNKLSYYNRRTQKYGGAKPSKSSVDLSQLGITKASQLKNLLSGTYVDSTGKSRVVTKNVDQLIADINQQNKLRGAPELKMDDFKKVKKAAASRGFVLNSFAGFMDFANMDIDLPPAVKQAASKIANSAKIAARGLGKAAIVLDPIFMAMDASEASRKGATGSQIGEFAVKSLVQDTLNLPNVLAGAGKYASDFLQGKRGDELNFDAEMLYKNRTFADDDLDEGLASLSKSQKLRNIADLDFNAERGNMTMVDDMEIPASKQEIEAARELNRKNKMGPYYKYGIETLPRKVAKPTKYDIKAKKVYIN